MKKLDRDDFKRSMRRLAALTDLSVSFDLYGEAYFSEDATAENKFEGLKNNINALRKDFELLLDYLGLDIKTAPKTRKITKKVSKK